MDIICGDCNRPTEVVLDHGTGDTICSECGLVLESHAIDETSEWRTFANDDNNNDDPNRVGFAHNPLFDDFAILKTDIINSKETKSTNMMNTRTIYRATVAANKSIHHLSDAYDRLAVISDRLGIISRPIIDRGSEIFKNVFYDDNAKTCRARSLDAVVSACVLVACQQENYPRTLKEVCAAVKDCNVSKKEVMKAKNLITKQLNDQGGDAMAGLGKTIRACDLVKRFCYNLNLNDGMVTKAALEIAEKCEDQVDVRRSPVSVAAAVIYVIVQLSGGGGGGGAGLKSVANATEVAEGTIKNTYRDMYPHLSKIVPTWYAAQSAINTLCVP